MQERRLEFDTTGAWQRHTELGWHNFSVYREVLGDKKQETWFT